MCEHMREWHQATPMFSKVCDAWTQHGGGPTAHTRSSRSSTIAVKAARAAMASQPTWLVDFLNFVDLMIDFLMSILDTILGHNF